MEKRQSIFDGIKPEFFTVWAVGLTGLRCPLLADEFMSGPRCYRTEAAAKAAARRLQRRELSAVRPCLSSVEVMREDAEPCAALAVTAGAQWVNL